MHKQIRKVFSVFALAMIVLFGLRVAADAWTPLNWVMMATAALVCLAVFRCFVFIFNYSYGLACLINGLVIAAWGGTLAGYLLGALMAIYGARLWLFTRRRMNSDSYVSRMDNVRQADAQLPFPVRIALWLQCTFLYTFHLWAVYVVASTGRINPAVLAGAAVILFGLLIEAVADEQKQAAKARDPDMFVTAGLYAGWRHPNYIGEILVQAGLIIAGLGAVSPTWGNIAAVVVAPLYVILLMISECIRADEYMQQRYGNQPAFREYLDRSGSFLPRY